MALSLTLEQKAEIAAESERLLNPGSTFNKIVTVLVDECIQELVTADVGDLTATRAHARMKALNDIKARIKALQNDYLIAKKQG